MIRYPQPTPGNPPTPHKRPIHRSLLKSSPLFDRVRLNTLQVKDRRGHQRITPWDAFSTGWLVEWNRAFPPLKRDPLKFRKPLMSVWKRGR